MIIYLLWVILLRRLNRLSKLPNGAINVPLGPLDGIPGAYKNNIFVADLPATRPLINNSGTRPISYSLDHVGPLTKTVSDMALVPDSMTQQDTLSRLPHLPKGLRLGLPRNYFFRFIDSSTQELFDRAVQNYIDLGIEVVELTVPFTDDDVNTLFTLAISEGAEEHAKRLLEQQELFGADVKRAPFFSS